MPRNKCIIVPFGCLVAGGVFRWNKKVLERCRESHRHIFARKLDEPNLIFKLEEEMLVLTDYSQIDKECKKYIVDEFYVSG